MSGKLRRLDTAGKLRRVDMMKDYGDRQTFEVPEGYEAVRDTEGRATGELTLVGGGPVNENDGIEQISDDLSALDEAELGDVASAAVAAEMPKPFVVRELEAKARIFEERNKLYGDNYKRFGPIMSLMLAGQIIDCNNTHAMARLGVLVQVVAKATRYGENFNRGGHNDSLDDIAVYAMMLKELDQK